MGLTPFEITHGYMLCIGLPLTIDTKFKVVKQFAQQDQWNPMAPHDAIIEKHAVQIFHTNRKCHASNEYKQGDHVYFSTQNLALPKGRARKLVPKFIGPYIVNEVHNTASTIMLELPEELTRRQIMSTFHASLIRQMSRTTITYFPIIKQTHSITLVQIKSRKVH